MTRRQPLQDLPLGPFAGADSQLNAGPLSQSLRPQKRLRPPDESICHPSKRQILAQDGILSFPGELDKSPPPSQIGNHPDRSYALTVAQDQYRASPSHSRPVLGHHNGYMPTTPALKPPFCPYPHKVVPRSPLSSERENEPNLKITRCLGTVHRSPRDGVAPRPVNFQGVASGSPRYSSISPSPMTSPTDCVRISPSVHYPGFDVYQDSLDLTTNFLFSLNDASGDISQGQGVQQTGDVDKENIPPLPKSHHPIPDIGTSHSGT